MLLTPSRLILTVAMLSSTLLAQEDRINAPIDSLRTALLRGNLHPKAQRRYDRGPVDPGQKIAGIRLMLKPTAAQQAALDRLLEEQQDPVSPNYHNWLTPEQYADRFGVSQSDADKIAAWLQTEGFAVDQVARGRDWISFSGTAGHVLKTFRAPIHRYRVDGETHFANAAEPSVPAVLEPLVRAIRGLDDFYPKPRAKFRGAISANPEFNFSDGSHALAPGDIATIYDVNPLYQRGITGSGQKIAVIGQTDFNLSDVELFRSSYGLPKNDPQKILAGADPGMKQGELGEANADLDWTGAVAPNASILYAYSTNAFDAATYAIDQNLAPVISMSYGYCEQKISDSPASTALAIRFEAQKANALGITWIAATGDTGAADCDSGATASSGLAVDLPASVPEVTGVGGTEFNEGTGQYWSSINGANGISALSYIPEMAWNDTALLNSLASSGGGASTFFSKPAWQSGPGVPNDNARDVPDVALAGSASHDGYFIAINGKTECCWGGTSLAAPVFAGMVALLNQYLVSTGGQVQPGLGNINPTLYRMAQNAAGVFHDVTTGSNIVPCASNSPNCSSGQFGYRAGPGYDLVTGLGSVDAYNLASRWSSQLPTGTTMTLSANPAAIPASASTVVTATVRANAGAVTPSGSVTFTMGGTTLGSVGLAGSGGIATASLTVHGGQLTVGNNTIAASYGGGTGFNGSSAAVTVTIGASSPPIIGGVSHAASFQQLFAPGMEMAIFGANLANSTQPVTTLPLPLLLGGVSATINGLAAPLYYVSPGQLNIQVPREIAVGTALLAVNNNGQVATFPFTVSASAPGIYVGTGGALVPTASASPGSSLALYITGDGSVTPPMATGYAPPANTPLSQLPRPRLPLTLTIGGMPVPPFFVGVPTWSVFVTQINFTVPPGVPPGPQPVVVTVGGVASTAATLMVTQ